MAKITAEMIQELNDKEKEEDKSLDAFDWVEENFEEMEVAAILIQRISILTMFVSFPIERAFLIGLSLGIPLGKKLEQIEMLDEKLNS